jgi:hypothetical protein
MHWRKRADWEGPGSGQQGAGWQRGVARWGTGVQGCRSGRQVSTHLAHEPGHALGCLVVIVPLVCDIVRLVAALLLCRAGGGGRGGGGSVAQAPCVTQGASTPQQLPTTSWHACHAPQPPAEQQHAPACRRRDATARRGRRAMTSGTMTAMRGCMSGLRAQVWGSTVTQMSSLTCSRGWRRAGLRAQVWGSTDTQTSSTTCDGCGGG